MALSSASTTGAHPLRQVTRPDFGSGDRGLRIVDIYAGSGGLTLGAAQAAAQAGRALDVRLALDINSSALGVYKSNFPEANAKTADVDELFQSALTARLSQSEMRLAKAVGDIDAIVGGPPCQGHSDLNNHTRRDDPRNEYYLRMVRAALVFEPDVVLIENVPPVRHAKSAVVDKARDRLSALGYDVHDQVVSLVSLGVPQRRRRHILLAVRIGTRRSADILSGIARNDAIKRDLRWAIGDLAGIKDGTGLDAPPRASETNQQRMKWLLDNEAYDLPNELRPPCHRDKDHSYKSMYGRLRWTEPAQTITSGFGSIGQGRYMHPDKPRALTAHEAARIQGFPDYFDFTSVTKRSELAAMIANAVPPQFSSAVFKELLANGWLASRQHLGENRLTG